MITMTDCEKQIRKLEKTIREQKHEISRLIDINNRKTIIIREAYQNERTELGKSVLRQLMEAME